MAKKTLKKMASGHSNKAAIYAAAIQNMRKKRKLWRKNNAGKRTSHSGNATSGSRKKAASTLPKAQREKKKLDFKKSSGKSIINKKTRLARHNDAIKQRDAIDKRRIATGGKALNVGAKIKKTKRDNNQIADAGIRRKANIFAFKNPL